MEYQNRPVEWMTIETEKIAKDKDNTARDAALLAGGVGAAAGASNINFKPVNKRKANLKTFLAQSGKVGIYTGAGTAALGQGMASYADHAAKKTKNLGEAMALMDAANTARDLRTQGLLNVASGAGSLMISKRIHPNPVNKKLLAAKLGLITGGAAAAAVGAHGLLKEKKAAREEIKDKKVYQDYVNRRQEGIRNQWKGIGGLLGGLTVGSALAATGTPLGAGLGTLAAIGGYGYGLGKLQQGDYQIGQASYIDPARRDNLFWDFSITPTEARYTRDVGFLDRLTGAEVDVTKKH